MNALHVMNKAVRAWHNGDRRGAEKLFQSVCYDCDVAEKIRNDALHYLCRCMDERNLWHESESVAMRIQRHWESEAVRRRERKRLTKVACGVGLICLLLVATDRRRAYAA